VSVKNLAGGLLGIIVFSVGIFEWAQDETVLAKYLCLLGIAATAYFAFAFYNARTSEWDEEPEDELRPDPASKPRSRWSDAVIPAVALILMGFVLLVNAHYAAEHHTVVPPVARGAWIYPWQAYAGAFFCFFAAFYFVVMGLWQRNR